MSEDANRQQLLSQAATSPAIGSPFTGAVCALLAERLDRSSAFGAASSSGPPIRTAMPSRSAAQAHFTRSPAPAANPP